MAGIALIRGLALSVLIGTAPAHADVAEAVRDVILPAYDDLAGTTGSLAAAAQQDCSAAHLREPFQRAWDAWARIDFLRLGPVETDGRALAISFWPDAKSSGRRAQQALIDADAPAIDDPVAFADLSVALRGLSGLERLIYPSEIDGEEPVLCRLRRATATDLARIAADIRAEWDGYGPLLEKPGSPGNSSFLTMDEARQALYTQLVTGLEHLADSRLGRPLGTFDKPRPERAEAIAAGRSLRNVTLSLQGIQDLAVAMLPDTPETQAAFARALKLAEGLDDPVLAGVAAPSGRLKVEILQQAVDTTQEAVETEIGGALGISVGFNAKDGD
ncbi:imelysin family protein [Paracoccus sp. MBLB3053]|uniref:Imelysin family protein n=1 Tax=Paracoccus aurantius TaxID=3073814 RepID=A0ABU2HUU6_9RHOB|nr:imelysin family protein [Paracoccus sp. MBLB3053]MDS9468828.1 imelysin family protein [Paracoccus sp. MBLB3053]